MVSPSRNTLEILMNSLSAFFQCSTQKPLRAFGGLMSMEILSSTNSRSIFSSKSLPLASIQSETLTCARMANEFS